MSTCKCEMCLRNNEFARRLAELPERDRPYWEGIYLDLIHAEMDRDWHGAIIDGSWPGADDILKRAREPRYELTDKGRELLDGK